MAYHSYDTFKQLLYSHRYSQAAFFASKAAQGEEPNKLFWLNHQAAALLAADKPKQTIDIADQILHMAPGNGSALLVKGDALRMLRQIDTAHTVYQQALSDPTVTEKARQGAACCSILRGAPTEALATLSCEDGTTDCTTSLHIRTLTLLHRTDEAIDLCSTWIRRTPDNRAAHLLQCTLELQRNGLEKVVHHYSTLAKQYPQMPLYRALLRRITNQAAPTQTIPHNQKSSDCPPASTALLRKEAFILARSGREAKALELLEILLRTDPADKYLQNTYGAAARRCGRLHDAILFFEELQVLYPEEITISSRIRKIKRDFRMASELYDH